MVSLVYGLFIFVTDSQQGSLALGSVVCEIARTVIAAVPGISLRLSSRRCRRVAGTISIR